VFVEAPQSVEELEQIAKAFPDVPTFANMIEGGKTPFLSSMTLEELGFKIVVYPLACLFSATAAMFACLRHLRENGTTEGFDEGLGFREFGEIVGNPKYRELEKSFSVHADAEDAKDR